jgi:thiol-disulfide isomerase/thioredoxin
MRFPLSALLSSIVAGASFGQDPEVKEPAPAPPQRALEVGDPLPPVVLEGLTQTPARSFSEFYGRAVLLDFFGYWCAPCAQIVPQTNELQAKYGPRGLSVVGVTTVGGKKTLAWVEKNGLEYAWGCDSSAVLNGLFQIQGIPWAVLIDPFGTVAWIGDPRRLKEETIESALANALERPVWEWPEEARPLAGSLGRAEFASALRESEKLPAHEGFDFQGLVGGRIAPLLERFDGLIEGGEYTQALELGERLEKGLETLPEGEELGARLEGLRSDPEIVRFVSAEKCIEAFEARAGALRKPADAEQLRAEVAAFFDTKPPERFERRAKILLDMLDKNLAKAKSKKKA